MIDIRRDIEKLILSTYLNYNRTFFLDNVEIYDFKCPYKLFKANFTYKLVSKAIFNLQSENKPLDDFVVLEYIEKNGAKFNPNDYLDIITATWCSFETFKKYILMLEEIEKEEDLKNKLGAIL